MKILFHAKKVGPFSPCMDGLWAAYAAYSILPESEFIPAMYGSVPGLNIQSGDVVYLLDLTYPASVLESWADRGAKVIVLDHHKSAMSDLSGLSDRIFQKFDMAKSGAMLAWERFRPNTPVPDLVRYVQDRDLWSKQLPYCDRVSLGLSELMHGKSLEDCLQECDRLMSEVDPLSDLMALGESAEFEIAEAIAQAVAGQTTRIVCGHVVPFFATKTKRQRQAYSDIGHALLVANPSAPFAVVETGSGWALRSMAGRADVSVLAKQIGGGGHAPAAGAKSDNMLARWP